MIDRDNIISAVKSGNYAEVNAVVTTPELANLRDEKGYSLLAWAAQEGHVDIMRWLLEQGAVVDDAENVNQSTPLHCAASQGRLEACELLIQHKADVNKTNNAQRTALWYAVFSHNMQLAEKFLQANADINSMSKSQMTLLNEAVWDNDLEAVKFLVTHHADLTILDRTRCTPLHNAAFWHHQDIVDFLSPYYNLDTQKIVKLRELSIVVNNKQLNKILQQYEDIDYESGRPIEFFHVVTPVLKHFISKHPHPSKLIAFIARMEAMFQFEKLSESELVHEIDTQQKIVKVQEYLGHSMPFIYNKDSKNNYWMIIIDRGPLAAATKRDKDILYPVRKLGPMTEEKFLSILSKVLETEITTSKRAEEIFLTDIPRLAELSYSNDERIQQKKFKGGQCYFENYKSLLLYEFIEAYGEREGKLLYKQFDIMLHEETLKSYMDYFREPRREEIKLCRDIIASKKNKLLKLAIEGNDAELVKKLLREDVPFGITKDGINYDAYLYAIHYGCKDEILDILEAHKQRLRSIELADDFAANPRKISLSELQRIADKQPLEYSTFLAKNFIENNKLMEAQRADPIFFDRYFINAVLTKAKHSTEFKMPYKLSDPIFLNAYEPENLIHLAISFAKGIGVSVDLLTAESLYRAALKKLEGQPRIGFSKSGIEHSIEAIMQQQTHMLASNDVYFNKWNANKNTQENLIQIFSEFGSWSLTFTSQQSNNKKQATALTTWLNTGTHSADDIRSYMLDKRFELLKSGWPANNNLIQLLNFAIIQTTPKQDLTQQKIVTKSVAP